MALQKEITDGVGNVSRYHKISSIFINYLNEKECEIMINVQSYSSVVYRNKSITASNSLKRYTFISSYSTDNIFKHCYDYLKTLPEFANAIDV